MRWLVVFLLLAGCTGSAARDEALMPAVEMAWIGVKEDILRGPSAVPDTLVTFDSAVQAHDTDVMRLLWPSLKEVAEANINAADMHEGVKGSRRERLIQFDLALAKLR